MQFFQALYPRSDLNLFRSLTKQTEIGAAVYVYQHNLRSLSSDRRPGEINEVRVGIESKNRGSRTRTLPWVARCAGQ
jgi:hypothetical protein